MRFKDSPISSEKRELISMTLFRSTLDKNEKISNKSSSGIFSMCDAIDLEIKLLSADGIKMKITNFSPYNVIDSTLKEQLNCFYFISLVSVTVAIDIRDR
jgi:hypothetical protein